MKRWIWLIGAVLWTLFINACNVWLIRPLVEDYAMMGVLAVVVLGILWLTSIPTAFRKPWITFTVFSLLLGTGLSGVMLKPVLSAVGLTVLMTLGLLIPAWLYSRWKFRYFFIPALVLIVVNSLLPTEEWTFLTHFSVAYRAKLPIDPSDLPAMPLEVISTPHGQAIATLAKLNESQSTVLAAAQNASGSADALENVLRNNQHRYQFEEITAGANGHLSLQAVPVGDLPYMNPIPFATSVFPFIRTYWTEEHGKTIQFMAPDNPPTTLMSMTDAIAYLPSLMTTVGAHTEDDEMNDWTRLLQSNGQSPSSDGLRLENGVLQGNWNGQTVSIPVSAYSVIATGAFTAPGAREVLVQGVNQLMVVSLNQKKVVATYAGTIANPLPSDISVGPIDNSGRDAIFVNASPSVILEANAQGPWSTLYTAPNTSLRFEGSVKFSGDQVPEILINDPSVIRNTPTRYFTSYTYRNGQLYRNWRVYRTNVVNVHPVQFTTGGPEYIALDLYGAGEMFVLQRHYVPVVPIASTLFGLILFGGWLLRVRNGRGRNHA